MGFFTLFLLCALEFGQTLITTANLQRKPTVKVFGLPSVQLSTQYIKIGKYQSYPLYTYILK